MKTMKNGMYVLLGLMFMVMTVNCSNKKGAEKAADAAEVAAETENVLKVSAPPFTKFVVVTVEEEGLYKEANKNSPTLVCWSESDCESDYCETIYQWSDQPGKEGFELNTDMLTYEGAVYPVLGEEGDFYRVCVYNRWCEIESAYIPKASVADIETAPVNAETFKEKSEGFYFESRVVNDGKYKGVVISDQYSEIDGETMNVGVLVDGALAIPLIYQIDASLNNDLKEDFVIRDVEGSFYINYSDKLKATEGEDGTFRIDLNKLTDEQIVKLVDEVTKKKPEFVEYMYLFPAKGPELFYYKMK